MKKKIYILIVMIVAIVAIILGVILNSANIFSKSDNYNFLINSKKYDVSFNISTEENVLLSGSFKVNNELQDIAFTNYNDEVIYEQKYYIDYANNKYHNEYNPDVLINLNSTMNIKDILNLIKSDTKKEISKNIVEYEVDTAIMVSHLVELNNLYRSLEDFFDFDTTSKTVVSIEKTDNKYILKYSVEKYDLYYEFSNFVK